VSVTLTIGVLGPVTVQRSATTVPLGGPKVRVLLAAFTAQHGSVLSTDRLCDVLWGDDQPGSPVTTLQSHLSRLRRILEPEATVVAQPPGYLLDVPDQTVDADRFEALASLAAAVDDPVVAAATFAEALGLWRGRAYEELADHDMLVGEAVRLEELRLVATERWIDARMASGDDVAVVGDLDRLVASDPLRERFWCQLMLALHRTGRQAEALRRAHELRTLMSDEFGLDVSPAASELEARIRAGDPRLVRDDARRDEPLARPRRGRPYVDGSTFVGRDRAVDDIRAQLAEHRLVSLVGPGGVGKTRLARYVVHDLEPMESEPVVVELAALRDPEAVPDAVATALDVQRRQHRTLEDTLVEVLGDRRQLVVLDNCEHVLAAACKLLDPLLAHCPGLRFVATSRQPLGLASEVVYVVEPLEVGSAALDGHALVDASPAVQLFVDRAAAARPGFELTDDNLPIVTELCRRLDGLPLALELAAARLRSLGPEAMVERLDQRFRLLDAGPHHRDQRHRTLGDLVGWSYELLGEREQLVFDRLSTFAGGFELRAAEAVCGGDDDDDILDVVLALVDKSMIQVVDPDEPRYLLLETLRAFGRDRLSVAGDVGQLSDAHLDWYLEVAEQAARGLAGSDEASWSARVDRDFDNLRAAHAFAVGAGDVDRALRMVAALREYAFRRIRYELTSWASTSVQMVGASEHPRYPVVLAIVAYGHFVRGDLEAAVSVGHDAVAAAERLGVSTSGLAERALGNAYFYLGRTDDALQWMAGMVESARRGGSPARLAHALYMSSVAETSVGRAVRGAALAGEARAAATASGSPTAEAQAMYAMGLALEGTDADESLELLRLSAATARVVDNRWIESFALTEVRWLEARLGDPLTALAGSAEVIESWYRGGDWANQWLSLRHVFGILDQLDDHRAAAILHGALTAAGAAYALPFEPADAERLDAVATDLRDQLGPEPFAAAVREGAAMPDTALVAFVLRRISALTVPADVRSPDSDGRGLK
jgi:predicted ATPase/DNA-binding SARP family transcriptional activator